MGFRHLTAFILMIGMNTVFACGHSPLPETKIVDVSYPVQSPFCDNKLPTSNAETQLPVPHIRQSQPSIPDGSNSLCWAAGIAMVATYLGKPVAPCQIATQRFGGGISCCHEPKKIDPVFSQACNLAASTDEISRILTSINLHFIHLDRPLSENEIRYEISNGRPILFTRDIAQPYVGSNGEIVGRHVLVISGYHHDKYHVLDPALKGGHDDLTYPNLINGKAGGLLWRDSWIYISFRADACNPRFNANCDCARR